MDFDFSACSVLVTVSVWLRKAWFKTFGNIVKSFGSLYALRIFNVMFSAIREMLTPSAEGNFAYKNKNAGFRFRFGLCHTWKLLICTRRPKLCEMFFLCDSPSHRYASSTHTHAFGIHVIRLTGRVYGVIQISGPACVGLPEFRVYLGPSFARA